MKYVIFSVYDTAVAAYHTPIFARNKGEMLRSFADAANNPQNTINKHPSDFVLFEIGSFDDQHCTFSLLEAPIRLGVAVEFLTGFQKAPELEKTTVPVNAGDRRFTLKELEGMLETSTEELQEAAREKEEVEKLIKSMKQSCS